MTPFIPRRRSLTAATLFIGVLSAAAALDGTVGAKMVWAQQAAPLTASAPVSQTKKPLNYAAYDTWRSIQGAKLSPTGAWAVYALVPQDGDGELVARSLKMGSIGGAALPIERRVIRGTGGVFSPDEAFVVCTVVPTKAERDRVKRARRPGAAPAPAADAPKNGLAIVPLATGKTQTVDRVKKWAVPEDGGKFFAYLMEDAPKPAATPAATPATPAAGAEAKPAAPAAPDNLTDFQQRRGARQGARPGGAAGAPSSAGAAPTRPTGTDLVLYEFATGRTVTVPNVMDFGWNKNGTRLWVLTSAKDADKTGVFVVDAPDASKDGALAVSPMPLKTGANEYKNVVWDDAGNQTAFLAADKPVDKPAAPATTPPPAPATKPAPNPAATSAAPPTVGEPAPPPKPDDVDEAQAQPPPAAAPAAAPATPTAVGASTAQAAPLAYQVYLWNVSDKGKPAQSVASAQTTGMPANMAISDNGGVSFSKSGARLFFAYAPKPKPTPKAPDLVVDVDIWSSRDPLLQPMQKVQATSERNRSYQAVYHVKSKKMVILGAPDLPDVRVSRDVDAPFVLASTDLAYQPLISWDGNFRDVYQVNVQTGERKKLLEKQGGTATLSPNGKYLLYFNEPVSAWYVMETGAKKPAVNLTGKLTEKFADEEDDHPSFPPAYGSAGWTANDNSVLLYDRYDTWEFFPNGDKPARKLTDGRASHKEYRLTDLDPDAVAVSTTEPLLFTVTNEATKATGLARRAPIGSPTAAPLTELVMLDKQVGGIQKAKKSDDMLLTWQRFDEYPNLWAGTLADPTNAVKISDANPQQANYVWGKSELITYKSEDGIPLQAVLTKPENFDPTKKYPLIVNIYERQTDRLNYYSTPAPGTSINISRYVSNGYLVLRPDIAYTPGYPGQSAQKCVLPAIAQVVAQGNVDPARIGIQGHSWGAYQIAYLITRTNLFRAVEAGAAVADMISAYGGIRWGTGQSRAGQYEKGQSRIGATPWTKPLQFIENSPIFWVDKVQTPYLTIHNDADGAVPWYQGIEFFTALRRLNKEAYMFDYLGEDHNLVQRDNQKHWTIHMDEFFDHYLLSKPRPDWMDNGVPYLNRNQRDVASFYNPPTESAAPAQTSLATPTATAPPQAPGGESKPVTGTTSAPLKK